MEIKCFLMGARYVKNIRDANPLYNFNRFFFRVMGRRF